MSALDSLRPEQFGVIRGGDKGIRGYKLPSIANKLYQREPEFMGRMEADIRENGVHNPVQYIPDGPNRVVGEGHHRMAAAYRAGADLPMLNVLSQDAQNHREDYEHSKTWRNSRTPEERAVRFREKKR